MIFVASSEVLMYSVAAFLAVVLACYAFADIVAKWAVRRRERAKKIQEGLHLERPLPLATFGGPAVFALLFVLGSLFGVWILGLVVGFILYRVIETWPEVMRARRLRRIDEQLPDAMTGLANSLRAGQALPTAIEQVRNDMPAPMSQELEQVLRDYRLGTPIEQAFENARLRLRRRDFDLCVAAFRIGKEQGGDVAQVFDRISVAIREIRRLEEHIHSVSSQGRSSARFMSLMPAVFLVILWFMDPASTMLLFRDPVGMVILSVVIGCNVMGHMWIKRILAVDV